MSAYNFEHVLLFSVPPVLAFVLLALATRRLAIRTVALIVALVGYALIVAKYTLFPIVIGGTSGTSSAEFLLRTANFVPLYGLDIGSRQFIGNIALGVPFGLLLPALVRWERRPWPALGACLGFGVALELLQFGLGAARLLRFRSLDVNDVMLNAAGAALGYAWLAMASAAIRWSGGHAAEEGSAPAPA